MIADLDCKKQIAGLTYILMTDLFFSRQIFMLNLLMTDLFFWIDLYTDDRFIFSRQIFMLNPLMTDL